MKPFMKIATLFLIAAMSLGSTIASAKPAQSKIKIVVWGEPAPQDLRPKITADFQDTFNKAHPNIEVDYQFTDDEWNATKTALQGGAGPDVVITPGPAFSNLLANAQQVLPLDDYAKKYGWQDKLQPWAYNSSMANGKLWSVPLTFETMLLYYNKVTFGKNGWKAPQSRADIEKICQAQDKAGQWCFSHSNQFWKGVNEWLISVFYNNYAGADKVQEALAGKRKWTDPLFAQSVDLLNTWQKNKWFSGGLDNYFALNYDDHMANFCSGKAPMNMEGTWALQNMVTYCTDKDSWDWAPLPGLRDGVTPAFTLAIGTSVSINTKSQHPDEAAMVIDWLYNDKARAAKITSEYGFAEWFVPIKWTSADFPEADPRVKRYIDAISDAISKNAIGYTTWSFWPAQTDQDIIDGMDNVFAGKLTTADYLQKQQDDFDKEFKAGGVPLAPTTSIKTP